LVIGYLVLEPGYAEGEKNMAKFTGFTKSTEGYRVELDAFSGPLELLFHLIKSQEINIYDIPIVQITGQYLEYLKIMEELDLDVAGEFLVMAATLMHIKSKMLLPDDSSISEDEEEEDPRNDLMEALLEYQRFKQAAERLGELANYRREIFDRGENPPRNVEEDVIDVSLFGLISAFRKVLDEVGRDSFTEITRSSVTVKEKIKELLNLIKEKESFVFSELFRNVTSRLEAIVSFLAVLELIKQKKIIARQNKVFGEIRILRREK